jgi:hypothetical protein
MRRIERTRKNNVQDGWKPKEEEEECEKEGTE